MSRHAAEIVIGDVGAALAVLLSVNSGSSSTCGLVVDMDDARAASADTTVSRTSCSAKAGRVEQLADMFGHVGIDPLVAGGGDRVALA